MSDVGACTQRAGSGAAFLSEMPKDAAFRKFLAHHLDVGTRMDEAIVTLLFLADNLTMGKLKYHSFGELMESDALLTAFAETVRSH